MGAGPLGQGVCATEMLMFGSSLHQLGSWELKGDCQHTLSLCSLGWAHGCCSAKNFCSEDVS